MDEFGSFLGSVIARATDEIGDIVPAISNRFFLLHPEAQASFAKHAPRNSVRLQSEMIDNCLYVIDQIANGSQDLEIMMELSIAHHEHALNVSRTLYFDLVRSTISILAGDLIRLDDREREQWELILTTLDSIAERLA